MKRFSLEREIDQQHNECLQRKVYVKGLPSACDQLKLIDVMSKFGSIDKAFILYNHKNGSSRGFGFVEYGDPSSAANALGQRVEICGKEVVVAKAVERQKAAHKSRPMNNTNFEGNQNSNQQEKIQSPEQIVKKGQEKSLSDCIPVKSSRRTYKLSGEMQGLVNNSEDDDGTHPLKTKTSTQTESLQHSTSSLEHCVKNRQSNSNQGVVISLGESTRYKTVACDVEIVSSFKRRLAQTVQIINTRGLVDNTLYRFNILSNTGVITFKY